VHQVVGEGIIVIDKKDIHEYLLVPRPKSFFTCPYLCQRGTATEGSKTIY
jgi:hypothetical protein